MRVSASRVGIAAGLIAGVYLAAIFAARGVPDAIVGLFGGPTGVARHGGLTLHYRLPPGVDVSASLARASERAATVRFEGTLAIVEAPGLSEEQARDAIEMWTRGGLAFHEVLEDTSLQSFGRGDNREVIPGVTVDVDLWRVDSTGEQHHAYFLEGDRPEDLTRGFDALRSAGWVQPPHSIIAFERVERSSATGTRERWQSHLLADAVLLDGSAVANATRIVDSITAHPLVQIEFTSAASTQFAKITERLVGRKLAMVLGGWVQSAPYINGPVPGGRVTITMGSGDLDQHERHARAMIAALAVVPLPAGGVIERDVWTAPAQLRGLIVIALVAIAVVGGACIGALVGVVIRITRPVWRSRVRRRAGRFPLRRLAVTLLAPGAWVALRNIRLPGVNVEELSNLVYSGREGPTLSFSLAELGVTPIITAYIIVEIASLLTARWRRARQQPGPRIAMGRYVAVLALIIAGVQSVLYVKSLAAMSGSDAEILAPDRLTQVAAVMSLVTGTMLLTVIAGVIRQHGLGNGYGAIVVSAWLSAAASRILAAPSAGHVLGVATLAVIAGATIALLRMRIAEEREAPLRVPASGWAPISTIGIAIVLGVSFHAGLRGLVAADEILAVSWLAYPWWAVGAIVVLVPLWSLAFARPAIVAPLVDGTALSAPRWTSWRRATLLSGAGLLWIAAASLLAAATHPDAQILGEATGAMMLVAIALDARDDLRARRADLVAVWPLHQVQHAELVHRVLTDAGIECHLQASHLRTLLALFGPYAPIDVLVPAGSEDAARGRIALLYRQASLERVFG